MNSLLFPSALKGLDIEITRTSQFATQIQTGASGKEQRASFWTSPRWTYELKLNFVRQSGFSAKTMSDELQQLVTFFNTAQGSLNSFVFVDPVNGNPSGVSFGTGNGSLNAFQLLDNEGYPAGYIQGTPSIYVNGVLKTLTTDYTINSTTGLVTFVTAPANTAALTWTGQFARIVRFDDDAMDFKRFVNLAWDGGTIKLRSIK
jgi:uncharacterized protein (TIGR02217 family)